MPKQAWQSLSVFKPNIFVKKRLVATRHFFIQYPFAEMPSGCQAFFHPIPLCKNFWWLPGISTPNITMQNAIWLPNISIPNIGAQKCVVATRHLRT
jgi:hypothetical protein